MNLYLIPFLCTVLLLSCWAAVPARAQAKDSAEAHVAAAKSIAASVQKGAKNELDYDYIIETQCTEPKPQTAEQAAAALNRPPNTAGRPRAEWYTDPVKVFDNLYYLGTNKDSVWAINTSAGIILIDANFHWDVEELVVNGMKKVG